MARPRTGRMVLARFFIPREVYDQLVVECRQRGLTFSWLVRALVRRFMDEVAQHGEEAWPQMKFKITWPKK